MESLPAGIFSGLTALTGITLYNNQLESLPAGIFFGLTALTTLTLRGNTVDPTIEVSLEKVGESGFRAVAPTGAPFAMDVPVTVENGTIESGATTVTIPVGAVESAVVTVVRTPGTLRGRHRGYRHPAGAAQRPRWLCPAEIRLPLEVLPAIGICERTEQVRDATLAKLGETECGNVFEAELASITGLLSLSRQGITSLKSDDLYGLTGLTQLDLGDNNQLNSLPEGIFSGLTALALLQISHNQLESLPEGIFSGLTGLTSLQISNNKWREPAGGYLFRPDRAENARPVQEPVGEPAGGYFSGLTALRNLNLSGNQVNPLPIPVSLEKVGDSGFKAVAPTGAPFEMVLPITVTNGAIDGGATTVTISLGDVQSAAVTVARKSGTSGAVTADIGTLPGLASGHHGYVLQKSALPLEILPAEGNVPPEFTGFILFEVGENQTTVTTVEAIDSDGDAVSYAITGGADQERFQIDATSGVLIFTTAPDYENPADADGDNQYVVIVTATSGTGDRALMIDRTIYVTVNDAAEDFCGRTQQVRDAILAKLGETNCGRVGSEDLATVSGILDLSNQEIPSLRFGDFSGLTALQQLDLKGNVYLNSLPDGVFSGLTALETLDLSETGLSSLPAGVFSGLDALETLDLAYNAGLSSLPVGVFSGLDALETLDLNDTGLSSLPAGVFSGLDALQRLDLTNNTGLSSLPVGVFSSLTALTDLNLSYNPLNSLNSDLFFSLTALTDLNLSHTDLSSLPAGIFSGLTALQRLDLRGNRVDPLPIVVSLEKVGDSGFKAIAPTGAPFTLVLPVTVTNGTIERGATTVTIAAGDVESAAVTVARTSGTTEAVAADIGTLPRLPDGHQGYTLRKAGGLPLEVEAANVAPEFKSAASFSVEENETIVGTVAATDADAGDEVSYAITGGVDIAQFQIDAMSGVLSFRTAPDFENPADVASTDPANEADNNEYIVTVSAISGTGDRTLTVMQTITVTVQDVVGGFCERTPQVRDAILAALTGVDNCGNVGTDELATVTDFPDLSGEGITSLQSGDFSGLTALTGLGLHDNQLSSLPHGIFADLTALAGLSLFNNPQLSSLPAGVFSGLSALRVLYLNDTGLSSLQSGIFAGLNALTELRLSNTGLSSLPDGVFSGLDALVELNLSNTQLSSLPSGVFAGLTALETLLLDNNPQLSSLPSGVFAGLTALTQLNLNSNQLSSLPDGIFAGLTALTQLDLGSNAVDPLPMPVSLEKVGDSGFKAVAPTGAPFALVLPVTVANGAIEGGATTVTIPLGAVESASVTVTRTSGTIEAVTVDIGTLAGLPDNHDGYVLQKVGDLPLEVLEALPVVSIAAVAEAVDEGDPAQFTLTLSRAAPAAGLMVSVLVTAEGSVLATPGDYTAAVTVAFGAGETQQALSVDTADDAVFEMLADAAEAAGRITATVQAGTGYELSADDAGATVTVIDDDPSPITVAADDATVVEGAGTLMVTITATTGHPRAPADAVPFIVVTRSVTATGGDDFTTLTEEVSIAAADFALVDGGARYAGKATLMLTILDDQVVEASETLVLELAERSVTPPHVTFGDPVTVTITDDDVPAWTVSVDPAEIAEAGGSATVTVSTGGVTFAAAQTIELDFEGGSATVGTDFTVADANGDALTSPYQLTLAAGESTVTATITAVDDPDDDDDEWIQVTATRVGEKLGEAQTITITDDDEPASMDATLSGLSLVGIALLETFDAGVTEYSASVDDDVTSVTLRAPPADDAAMVEVLDADDMVLADADPGTDGHQVNLEVGANTIKIKVTSADGNATRTYTLKVTRAGSNAAPQFTSAASFSANENQTAVGTVEATDADAQDEVSYALSGGADLAQFAIDAMSGELSFRTAPDYESPADVLSTEPPNAAGDNEYLVTVTATGGTGARALTAEQTITVTVNDLDVGFCERTPEVRDAILAELGDPDCTNVVDDDLATITVYLQVSNTGITSLKPGDFSGLTALEALAVFGNAQLSSLPEGIFAGLTALERLHLAENAQLSSLPEGIFAGLTALERLELESNELSSLPEGIFAGLAALEWLDLSSNELSSLPEGIFAGLAALELLELNSNELSSLPEGLFAGLTALEVLHLHRNPPLSSLPEGIFAGLTALQTLSLDYTQLSSLPEGIFAGLTALTTLRLQGNQLSNVPEGLFAGLAALEGLHLDENPKLSSLQPGTLSGLTALQTLSLDHTQLSSLPDGIFADLLALTVLRLDHTPLENLPSGVFSGLTALTTLDLSRNQLTSLPARAFAGLTALATLYLNSLAVDPLPLPVSLEKVGDSGVKAVAPTGAPFALVLPVTVTNGAIDGGATTVTIPLGDVESAAVTVARTDGTTEAVTADLGTLPGLPDDHGGYALHKAADLPLEVLPEVPNAAPQFTSAATFSVDENRTTVGTVVATDANAGDAVRYAITGGADSARFQIDGGGVLSFQTAPDYENPTDVESTDPVNAAGNNEYIVIVTATGGTGDRELTAEQTITVTVTDVDDTLPAVSIAAVAGAVDEGDPAQFTLALSAGAPADGLMVSVLVNEEGSVIAMPDNYTSAVTVAFAAGETEQALSVDTADDDVYEALADAAEAAGRITATVQAGTGYTPGANASATVTVRDDDVPAWAVSVDPGTIAEAGGTSTVTVSTGGVTFAAAQTIDLDFAGTALAGTDFAVADADGNALTSPYHLTLSVGAGTVMATITAVDDDADDDDETIEITAKFADEKIGDTQTVTITDDDGEAPATNAAPVFTSDAAFPVNENETTVGTVVATDADADDAVRYAITGGADSAQFQIGETGGALSFASAPDYENPTDVASTDPANAAGNNEYIVTVTATGGTGDRELTAEQTITVTVNDVDVGFCERTPQVRDAILAALTNVDDCARVGSADLATVEVLDLHRIDAGIETITSLKAGDFAGLAALKVIDLSFHDLASLPAEIFAGLTALESLRLSGNDLASLPAGIFAGLTALEDLWLGRNDLASLPAGIFAGLTALEDLRLGGNDLASLPAGIFAGLTALAGLDLSANGLDSLEQGVFAGLTALEELELQSNSLSSLPAGIFADLTVLNTLALNLNEFGNLSAGMFTGLTGLTRLDLSDNVTDPVPLPVSLEKVGESGIKAVAPAGAPFALVLPVTVTNGAIDGAATTLTIPAGSRESAAVTVARTDGTTEAVAADLGTLPGLPDDHGGYALHKAADLPLEVLPEVPNAAPQFTSAATFSVDENRTTVGTVVATDADAGDAVRYAITGGADSARFQIDGGGVLSFQTAPDYENPTDVASTDPVNVAGNNEYIVIVTATGGTGDRELTAEQTITVTVTDVDDTLPAVSIAAVAGAVDEGDPAQFTLALSAGAPADGLMVSVLVNEEGSVIAMPDNYTSAVTVAFAAGETEQALSVDTADDDVYEALADAAEAAGRITATVQAGTDYAVAADAGSATVTVNDDEPSPITVTADDVEVSEGAGSVAVTVVAATTHARAPSDAAPFTVFSSDDSAEQGEDYGSFDEDFSIAAADFVLVDGGARYAGEATLMLTILDDQVVEGEETLYLWVDAADGPPHVVGEDRVTVTITDDDVPAWAVSVAPGTIAEAGGTSTVTVSTGGVTFPAAQTIDLDFAGTALAGTDFAVADADGTALTSPYHLTLSVGAGTVMATITAVDDDADDDDETIEITAKFADEKIGDTQTVTITDDDGEAPATNAAPVFTSDAAFAVNENETTVGTVVATDADADDAVRYAITGGADSAQFQIGETSGALSFASAPDYENPADVESTDPVNAAGNNEYIVIVTATGGTGDRELTAEQTITVTVNDVDVGFCERTPQVRDAILAALTNVDDCARVGSADLATVEVLDLHRIDAGIETITSLKAGDFAGLAALKVIDLSFHDLESLPAEIFAGLTALEDLRLSGNDLASLPAGIFAGLTALEDLWLGRNDLASLPAGIFAGLTALEDLRLGGNDLASLPAGIFAGLTALAGLDLSANGLDSLEQGVFAGLTALEELELQSNSLSSLPAGIFADLTVLKTLALNLNEFGNLSAGMFTGLTGLTRLDLSDNVTDPVPLPVSLEKVGESGIKAVAPAGAPFALVLPVTVTNGAIDGSATTLTIPAGSRESAAVTVARTDGTTEAVTADLGTLPGLPDDHGGYALHKAADLPLEVLPEVPNAAPQFTSAATFSVNENQTAVGTVEATDADAGDEVSYAITGGADSARFRIDGGGVLSFQTAPDYENPTDVASTDPVNVAGNNEYIVIVTATGGTGDRELTAEQTITVTVNDVDDTLPAVSIAAVAEAVDEGDPAQFTLALSAAAPAGGLMVSVLVNEEGSVIAMPDNYTSAVTVAFAAGEMEQALSVDTADDDVYEALADAAEAAGRITATVQAGTGYTPGANASATVTVRDDDVPVLSLMLEPAAIVENGGSSTVTARLSSAVTEPFAVTVSAQPVAPAVTGDFMLSANTTLSFAAGVTESSGMVTVSAVDNDLDEPARAVTVSGTASAGSPVQAPEAVTLTLVDDDEVPAVQVADVRVVEGETAVFTVLLAAASGRRVDALWGMTAGTATEDVDYTKRSGTLAFAAGETRKTITVATATDATVEADETFVLWVQRVQYDDESEQPALVRATGTIVDDDDPQKPGRVTDLAAAAAGPFAIALSWSAPAYTGTGELQGYRIEMSADGGVNWSELVADSGDTATTYLHDGLQAEQTRHYRVQAIGTGGHRGLESAVAGGTSAPGIRAVEITSTPASRDTYGSGEEIVVTVTFSRSVILLQPMLALGLGGGTVSATCRESDDNRCTADPSVELSYTVQAGDLDRDGIEIGADALAAGGTLDEAADPVDLSHAAGGVYPGHRVAGTPLMSLMLEPAAIFENGGRSTVTARLSSPVTEPFAMTVTAAPVAPAGVGDFVLSANTTLSFAAQATESSGTVTILAVDNGLDAPDREVTVSGSVPDDAGVAAPADATLTLLDDDAAPAGPVLSAVGGDRHVTLSWSAPDPGTAAITGYDYRVSGDDGATYEPDWTDVGNVTRRTVTGLTNGTAYTFEVRAKSAAGPGQSSAPVTVLVANALPMFAAASTTRSIAENTTRATPIGAPVTADDADAAVGSTLTYRLQGADADAFAIDATGGQLRTRAALNHEARERYAVTVRATDDGGAEATIAVTIAVTDELEPPAAPAAPVLGSATATGVPVSWTAPANTGPPITGYDLQYRTAGATAFSAGPQQVAGTSTTLVGLAAGTAYEVQVRAGNDEGLGGWSASAGVATAGGTTPALMSATVDGADLVLTYDAALDDAATPGAGAYAVAAGGAPRAVSAVAVSGTTVTLTLASAVYAVHAVTVSYTPPAQDAVRGAGGGAAVAALDGWAVTNVTARPKVIAFRRHHDDEQYHDSFEVSAFDARLIIYFDRPVTGLDAGDVRVVNGEVVGEVEPDCRHARTTFCVTLRATGENGQILTVDVGADVVDQGNLPTVPYVEGEATTIRAFPHKVSGQATQWRAEIKLGDPVGVTITSAAEAPVRDSFKVVFRFSEAVLNRIGLETASYPASAYFQTGDLRVTNGSAQAGGLSTNNATEYEQTIHPRVPFVGTLVVELPARAVQTQLGAGNRAARFEIEVDTRMVASFAPESDTATEGGAAARVQVSLTRAPASRLVIPLTAAGGDGAVAADYTVPADVEFAVGEMTRTITVAAVDDAYDDDGETVQVGFGELPAGVFAGEPAAFTVALLDDDPEPALAALEVAPARIVEGGTATVTVRTNGSVFAAAQSVALDFTGSAAAAGTDFTVAAGGTELSAPYAVTLAAGAPELELTVTALADGDSAEGDETIVVAAEHAGRRVGPRTVTIDDTAPRRVTAAASAEVIVVTYDEALDTGSTPSAAAFTVHVAGGTAPAVSGVSVTGSTVTLALATALTDERRGDARLRRAGGARRAAGPGRVSRGVVHRCVGDQRHRRAGAAGGHRHRGAGCGDGGRAGPVHAGAQRRRLRRGAGGGGGGERDRHDARRRARHGDVLAGPGGRGADRGHGGRCGGGGGQRGDGGGVARCGHAGALRGGVAGRRHGTRGQRRCRAAPAVSRAGEDRRGCGRGCDRHGHGGDRQRRHLRGAADDHPGFHGQRGAGRTAGSARDRLQGRRRRRGLLAAALRPPPQGGRDGGDGVHRGAGR